MAAIEVEGLAKSYGTTWAIRDLDFTVPEGAIYGLFGPNGAGKSTLIDMVLDFSRPVLGSITVLGADAQADVEAVHESVGVLPDGYDFVRGLSARRHLAYTIAANDADDDPDDLLETVGLGGVGGYPPDEYSNGMAQRLALANALVGDPPVLILDEPFSGLDPSGMDLLRSIVQRRNAEGTTVFLATHMIPQVSDLVDHVGLLADGRMQTTGTPEALLDANDGAETLSDVYSMVVG